MTTAQEKTVKIKQLEMVNDTLKANITQLRTDIDALKDEIIQLLAKQKGDTRQLTTLLDTMAVNNQNQIQQISLQSSEIVQLRAENQQIQVSLLSMYY